MQGTSTPTATALRRSPLHDLHEAAGARLVPFAGWEMPVSYEGVREEHLAVRGRAGAFDVSHMGQIETEGPEAGGLLQRLLSNDVGRIEVGGAQYSVLCRVDGGILDDLFTYRLADDRYLTVTNAANHERDLAWFAEHARGFDAEVADRRDSYAMLAVQGPEARHAVAGLFAAELPPRMRAQTLPLAAAALAGGAATRTGAGPPPAGDGGNRPTGDRGGGAEALVCGTGYTGEDGVEVLIDPGLAAPLWRALLDAGVAPCGLAARDTLRLEACFHLYGNDMDESRNPIEAGLGWCCKEETGFLGSDAVATARERGTAERLAPFALTGEGIPRQGNPVLAGGERARRGDEARAGEGAADGERVGVVTSGTLSPSLGRGIGMAYVRSELAEPGTEIDIDVRGRQRPARVERRPLYRRDGE